MSNTQPARYSSYDTNHAEENDDAVKDYHPLTYGNGNGSGQNEEYSMQQQRNPKYLSNASSGSPAAQLAYRVRGGQSSGSKGPPAVGSSGIRGNNLNSSLNSSFHSSDGGWVVQADEDAAAAEEALKLELKKAKVLLRSVISNLFFFNGIYLSLFCVMLLKEKT
jgi:hypothetical protein